METPQNAKAIEPVWPDETLEKEMLLDGARMEMYGIMAFGDSVSHDANCHIKALLCRVRELEKECAELRMAIARHLTQKD